MPRSTTLERPKTKVQPKPEQVAAEPTKIIAYILDKSGSMGTIKQATIDGFNEYLAGLQSNEHANEVLFTLTQFDSLSIDRSPLLPVSEVVPLTTETYVPRSATPLYDAVVETVESVYADVKRRHERCAIMCVIMTDGYENASHKHDQSCLRELVETLENGGKGDWTFLYMGANQDAWALASQVGISYGNTQTWHATLDGTAQSFRQASAGTINYFASTQSASQTGAAYANRSTLHNTAATSPPTPPPLTSSGVPYVGGIAPHTHLGGHTHASPSPE